MTCPSGGSASYWVSIDPPSTINPEHRMKKLGQSGKKSCGESTTGTPLCPISGVGKLWFSFKRRGVPLGGSMCGDAWARWGSMPCIPSRTFQRGTSRKPPCRIYSGISMPPFPIRFGRLISPISRCTEAICI